MALVASTQFGYSLYNILLFVVFPVSVMSQGKACYFKDGSLAANDYACYPNNDISFCCGPGYACLDDLVCEKTNDAIDPYNNNTYVRGSCTDYSWGSTACPNFCTGIDHNDAGGNVMTLCPGNTSIWCCASNQVGCDCSTGSNTTTLTGDLKAFTTIGIVGTSTSTANSSSTTTSTSSASTTTSSPAAIPTAASTAPPSATASASLPSTASGLSTGAKVGLGIGIPLGLAIIVYLFWRTQAQKQKIEALSRQRVEAGTNGGYSDNGVDQPKAGAIYEMSPTPSQRLFKAGAVYEMPHSQHR